MGFVIVVGAKLKVSLKGAVVCAAEGVGRAVRGSQAGARERWTFTLVRPIGQS